MIKDKIIEYRRHIHQNPEIGFNTKNTNDYVMNILKNLGYKVTPVLNGAGCIASLDLNKETTIGFRSDLDALPIKEQTNLPFKSENGNMHACGHDAHIAILLGAANLFMLHKNELKYNIVLVFQPAEEGPLPGGAINIIKEYDLSNVKFFFAYHVTNKLFTGQIGIKAHEACAAPDLWELEIVGKGCHASTPHLGKNPIIPASIIVEKFQELHNKLKDNHIVISTTFIQSGVSMNIITDKCLLKGTARSFTKEQRDYLNSQMYQIIEETCKTYKVEFKFSFHYAYDPVYNDDIAISMVKKAAAKILDSKDIISLEQPEMVGEDFSYYRKNSQICLTWLGVRAINEPFYDLHSANFLLDENALLNGSLILLNIALGN